MNVLSYANADYERDEDDRWAHRSRQRLTNSQWHLLGQDLGGVVIPFSFWRSRLRKLLVDVDQWCIAIDEVGQNQLRARALFEVADYPIRFEMATGRSNSAGALIDGSAYAMRHLERVWVEPKFDACCSVSTSSPAKMRRVLEDGELQRKILAHPNFTLGCTAMHATKCALLSLTVRPKGIDQEFVTMARDLIHAMLRRLQTMQVATAEGVPWTIGV
jgi:hypothetical protein